MKNKELEITNFNEIWTNGYFNIHLDEELELEQFKLKINENQELSEEEYNKIISGNTTSLINPKLKRYIK